MSMQFVALNNSEKHDACVQMVIEKGCHIVPTQHVVIRKHSRCYLHSLVQITWLNKMVLQKHVIFEKLAPKPQCKKNIKLLANLPSTLKLVCRYSNNITKSAQ